MAYLCVNLHKSTRTRRTFTHILMAGGYFPCTVIPSEYIGFVKSMEGEAEPSLPYVLQTRHYYLLGQFQMVYRNMAGL